MINFSNITYVHFIGIGGIGNSAIAEILMHSGIKVTGSDIKKSEITENLKNKGAEIFIGHNKNNISNPDLVVYSSAINEDNDERMETKKLEII